MDRRQFLGITAAILATPWRPLTGSDLNQHYEALATIWEMNHLSTAVPLTSQILSHLAALYHLLDQGFSQPQEILALLCRYHIVMASITEDQQNNEAALFHEHRAVELAQESGDQELYAVALHRRAATYFTRELFDLAAQDFGAAFQLQSHLSPPTKWAIHLKFGLTLAHLATISSEKKDLLLLMDKAGNAIARGETKGTEDPHAFRLTPERYHLDKARALLALNLPNQALDELSSLSLQDQGIRRTAYRDLLLAKAFMQQKDYPQATHFATSSLVGMQNAQSQINIHRIKTLHDDLKMSSYGGSNEVTRLTMLLMT